MTKKTTAALTTACVGLAATTAAYMMSGGNGQSKTMKARTKKIKRTTGKALRQVGDFIDNVSYMMR